MPATVRVTVLIPVRNGAAFLDASIRSVLLQTLADFELIVVDDGSIDRTRHLLQSFGDPRIRVLRQPLLGLVTALNRGFAEARAPLVARMDADDVARPERLARQVAAMAAGDLAAVGAAAEVIGPDGARRRTLRPPCAPDAVAVALQTRNCMIHPAVMVRRDAVLAAGGYRGAFARAEDYDLWLRLIERHRISNLPDVLLEYREHVGQSAWRSPEQRILSELGAQAAARLRARGEKDGGDGPDPIDRAALARMGMSVAEIDAAVLARALGSARDALAAGNLAAARAAIALARRQPDLRTSTRAHLLLLSARARPHSQSE